MANHDAVMTDEAAAGVSERFAESCGVRAADPSSRRLGRCAEFEGITRCIRSVPDCLGASAAGESGGGLGERNRRAPMRRKRVEAVE